MTLVDRLTDVLWDAFTTVPNCYADRKMDVIDTGGNYESFRMQHIAEHLIGVLGLEEHFAPAVRLHDGAINPDTQWEYDEWQPAADRAKIFGERIATRIVGRWTWARNQIGNWIGIDDLAGPADDKS